MDSLFNTNFIINDNQHNVYQRFQKLIEDCKSFDCLVAYFYLSGFHLLSEPLEKTQSIRILVGIGTSGRVLDLLEESKNSRTLSHRQVKEEAEKSIIEEMEDCPDSLENELGIARFVEWAKNGKLKIRAYPTQKLHAKLYIMTFHETDRDTGRVITGSSNFTRAGLQDNLEFNVELKDPADYEYARQKFEELWKDAVDVTDLYLETLKEKTWLNENITPYELFLKFLYVYFQKELSQKDEDFGKYLPKGYKNFAYQRQAVLNAKRILEEYGGVFISDVVGLGKTPVTAMLVKQLPGNTIVIAPPALLDEFNPGSWPSIFSDFNIVAKYVSTGKLDDALKHLDMKDYHNIVIDESHRFRNESTIGYEKIAEICRGKRVILVSATPFNNSPKDLLAQIKLFQKPYRSTIPGLTQLEPFFNQMEKNLDRKNLREDYNEYLNVSRQVAREIREKVLKYIMVRRTRAEIEKYFADDLKENNVEFPEVEKPKALLYQLNEREDEIFTETVTLITQKFKYTRYIPLLYLKSGITHFQRESQENMRGFMKTLLVKRLESSFYAFRKSVERLIKIYQKFIQEYEKGNVYISKKYINKIFELIEQGNDEAIQNLIEEDKAEKYSSTDFRSEFAADLKTDLEILQKISKMWEEIQRDPKLDALLNSLQSDPILKNNKLIIFTESQETAEYLAEKINTRFNNIALLFHGASSESIRNKVIENFDAKYKNQKDDYRILISTEVLAEGVNLHRSNVVINYDIPWNPTKLMQRVGRINRIDTKFDKIYIYNFFPTVQADSEIELTNIARSKIEQFLSLLGGDAAILTEGEPVASYELFDKLNSKETFTERAEESELKYYKIIENIRDNDPKLFEKIKRLPKKLRSSKKFRSEFENIARPNSLLTFFRRGQLMKFFIADSKTNQAKELDFLAAARILECAPDEKRVIADKKRTYELLEINKKEFEYATMEEEIAGTQKGGSNVYNQTLKILKALQQKTSQLTEEQEDFLKIVIKNYEEHNIAKRTANEVLKKIKELGPEIQNTIKVIGILQTTIPPNVLEQSPATGTAGQSKKEVILSIYLKGEHDE